MLTIILAIVLGLILVVVILNFVAPKTYDVSRSIAIKAPRSKVFEYVRKLENYNDWSPWARKDPNMKSTHSGTPGEVGSISRWEGNKDVGVGEQEIKRIKTNDRIESEIRFIKPWNSVSDAYFNFEDSAEGTQITWGFKGKNKFPLNIVTVFASMDKMVGKDFEAGLSILKSKMEEPGK